MNKYFKSIFVVPVAMLAVPMAVGAVEQTYTEWQATEDVYHLYDDVRTVTFSEAVDPVSLGNIQVVEKGTNNSVKTVVTIGDRPNQLKIQLAPDAQYMDNVAYTLSIEGVKSKHAGQVVKPVSYTFKMINQQPEHITFKNSYIIENTSSIARNYIVPEGASYVVYDPYGVHHAGAEDGVMLKVAQSVTLQPKEQMTISFMEQTTLNEQQGFTQKVTDVASHDVFKLHEKNSLEITGVDSHSYPDIYFGNSSGQAYASYAEYSSYAEEFNYRVVLEDTYEAVNLAKNNQVIVTNEEHEPLYVYAPKTAYSLTAVRAVEEQAVKALTLGRNEKLQAEAVDTLQSTALQYSVPQGDWKISYASYSEDSVQSIGFHTKEEAAIVSGGSTIIRNEVGVPLTVSGPGRYVSFMQTTEEPLTFYTVPSKQKVKVLSDTTTPHAFYLKADAQPGQYSKLSLENSSVSDAALQKTTALYDESMMISKSAATILENTGEQPLLLYGSKRHTLITDYQEVLFKTIELAPNERIQVVGNNKTKLYLKDVTLKGTYTFTQVNADRLIDFQYNMQTSHNLEANETVMIKNTGQTKLTVFGNFADISFIK